MLEAAEIREFRARNDGAGNADGSGLVEATEQATSALGRIASEAIVPHQLERHSSSRSASLDARKRVRVPARARRRSPAPDGSRGSSCSFVPGGRPRGSPTSRRPRRLARRAPLPGRRWRGIRAWRDRAILHRDHRGDARLGAGATRSAVARPWRAPSRSSRGRRGNSRPRPSLRQGAPALAPPAEAERDRRRRRRTPARAARTPWPGWRRAGARGDRLGAR